MFYSANGKIIEHIGDISSDDLKVKTDIQNKQNISRDTLIKASTKITNNVSNQVAQSNQASINNNVLASNLIALTNSSIDGDLNIVGTQATSSATAETKAKIDQTVQSNIQNDFKQSISKEITNQLPDAQAEFSETSKKLTDQAMAKVNKLAKSTDKSEADKNRELVKAIMNPLGSKESQSNRELQTNIKNTLNLSEDFTFEDQNELENTINNKIDQQNVAGCYSSVSAENRLLLQNLDIGGDVNLKDNKFTAMAKSVMECIIDQELTSDISNKISNIIESRINRLVEGASDDKKELAKAIGEAVKAGIVDSAYPDPNEYPDEVKQLMKDSYGIDINDESDSSKETTDISDESSSTNNTSVSDDSDSNGSGSDNNSDDNNDNSNNTSDNDSNNEEIDPTILWGIGFGIGILILIIIIIAILSSRN